MQDLLDFHKMVSDAKTDEVTITFKKIDLSEDGIVAIGDSSFANVGKSKTASQAGLIILLAQKSCIPCGTGRAISAGVGCIVPTHVEAQPCATRLGR